MIAITGGKTGGHIIPLIEIAKKLKDKVIYVGNKESLEEKIAKENKIDFIALDNQKPNIWKAYKESKKLKKQFGEKPKAIISTGGYVSLPLILYGIFHKVDIYLIEENLIMGSTNQVFSLFSKKVFLSYELEKMKKKYMVVGQPIKSFEIDKFKYLQYDILIIGGSLGSRPLCDLASNLAKNYRVCLVAGRYKDEYKSKEYDTFSYVNDLHNLMANSKVIISRAGAATTSEIFYLEKPAVLVPSLNTKKNHQYINALYFEQQGACYLVNENQMEDIYHKIETLFISEGVRINMKNAQKKLVNINSSQKIASIVEGNHGF